MPILAFFLRFFRKKIVVACFVGLATLLLLANIFYHGSHLIHSEQSSVLHLRKLNQPFNWHLEDDLETDGIGASANSSELNLATCRNSVQGKTVIADDKGYVCPRTELQGNGCCNTNSTLTNKYVCTSCEEIHSCCTSYEHCISCCLRPEQRTSLQQILNQAAESNNVLFVSVTDHFELCLAKCRTSSSSVHHENTYRNINRKYCYGKNPPPTVGSVSPL